MQGRTIRTPEKGERLLKQLALGKSVSAACRAEKIGRSAYYDWRGDDPVFAAAADQAIEEGTDRLEDSALSRGLKGDATLTIFLLKARRPEKYRERIDQRLSDGEGNPLTIVIGERRDGPA